MMRITVNVLAQRPLRKLAGYHSVLSSEETYTWDADDWHDETAIADYFLARSEAWGLAVCVLVNQKEETL